MTISKMLPIGGFAIAVALVGITSAFKDAPKTNTGSQYADQSYFEFTGTHGQEDQRDQWDEISQTAYEALDCIGDNNGCKLRAEMDSTDLHPIEVYVDNSTNQTPVTGTYVSEVLNKD